LNIPVNPIKYYVFLEFHAAFHFQTQIIVRTDGKPAQNSFTASRVIYL